MTKDNEHIESLNDQMIVRREKMEELRKNGVDPYSGPYKRSHYSSELIAEYDHLSKEELSEESRTS